MVLLYTASWHLSISFPDFSSNQNQLDRNIPTPPSPCSTTSHKCLSPLPFCNSPVTRPSPGGLPSWSFHFQSTPRTTLLPTFRCFSICERMRRRWRRRAASTSRAALPGHRDQQGFSDLANLSPAVTTLEDDCSGPVESMTFYKCAIHLNLIFFILNFLP